MMYNNMLMQLFNRVRNPYRMPVEPPQMNGQFQPMSFEGNWRNPVFGNNKYNMGQNVPNMGVPNMGTGVPNMGTNALRDFRRGGMMNVWER